MASIDLKDTYYSVPIYEEHKTLLQFKWKGQVFEFSALPNGLALASRQFTKLLKPIFASLRKKGHISTSFLDDSLLTGQTEWDCISNIRDTLLLFRKMGFVIHPTKSILKPSKQIQNSGEMINSETMTVSLTPERINSLKADCKKLLKRQVMTVREVAHVIGKMIARFPAVRYGPLHYRSLENDKKRGFEAM